VKIVCYCKVLLLLHGRKEEVGSFRPAGRNFYKIESFFKRPIAGDCRAEIYSAFALLLWEAAARAVSLRRTSYR